MQQVPTRKINRENPSKLILIFDPNPKEDYSDLLSKFPFNAEVFVDLLAKEKFQYSTTVQVINPTDLTALQGKKVSEFDTCTIIFLEGSRQFAIDILSNPILKENIFKIYVNKIEQSTLFLISSEALQRQVIFNFLNNYMSCIVLNKNGEQQDPEVVYKRQIWQLIDFYNKATLQIEYRNQNTIIGTFNYNSKHNHQNIFYMIFKMVDGELTEYELTQTRSSYVPSKGYVNLHDTEAFMEQNNFSCHQGRFNNKLIQQGYDMQKQAEGLFQDGKLVNGTIQVSDLTLEAKIVYKDKEGEDVLVNEMVIKKKDFEGVCFDKLYNQGRFYKGDQVTEEGYFRQKNQGIYEGVIKKDGVVTQLKEIKNTIIKTWEFEIGQLKANNEENVVIRNVYNILKKEIYYDVECEKQNFKLKPSQLSEKLESLYSKLKHQDLLHFIISDQSEIVELFTLIRKFNSQGKVLKNKGVPAEIYILITDLTDSKIKNQLVIKEYCFDTFLLKKIQENKFVLLAPRTNIDVLIQRPNKRFISVQIKGDAGIYEVLLEGDKVVSRILKRSPPLDEK